MPTKQHIPWIMATTRAALGPIMILGATCRWNGIALATLILAALLSDIFDGILARRWHCDTPALRLSDSLADTVFYLGVAIALWIAHPTLLHAHPALLEALFALEAARLAFDFAKFGKPASYHSYLAKTWGLVLATAVIAAFATHHANPLLTAAISLGILCDLEGLTLSLLLPRWRNDVKTLHAAWKVRQLQRVSSHADASSSSTCSRSITAVALALFLWSVTRSASGQTAIYILGTAAAQPSTAGVFDLSSPGQLVFKPAPPTPMKEIDMTYDSIQTAEYRVETAHHLGVLPAIAVGLVWHRQHKHYLTIGYTDQTAVLQSVVFDLDTAQSRTLIPILLSRAPACGKRTGCMSLRQRQ